MAFFNSDLSCLLLDQTGQPEVVGYKNNCLTLFSLDRFIAGDFSSTQGNTLVYENKYGYIINIYKFQIKFPE